MHADVDHSQTIGGDTVKLCGGIYPPSPSGFGTPEHTQFVITDFNELFSVNQWREILLIMKDIFFRK